MSDFLDLIHGAIDDLAFEAHCLEELARAFRKTGNESVADRLENNATAIRNNLDIIQDAAELNALITPHGGDDVPG